MENREARDASSRVAFFASLSSEPYGILEGIHHEISNQCSWHWFSDMDESTPSALDLEALPECGSRPMSTRIHAVGYTRKLPMVTSEDETKMIMHFLAEMEL